MYTDWVEENEESLVRYKGYSSEHHDWTSDIRRETNSLKENTENLESEKRSLDKYVSLKEAYLANLAELNPSAASALLEEIETGENLQREHIGELQKIRDSGKNLRAAQAAQSTGCLLPLTFLATFAIVLLYLLIF